MGKVTTPKVGLIYEPGAALTLKASWGRSFKAPTLYQQYVGYETYLLNAADQRRKFQKYPKALAGSEGRQTRGAI